MVDKQQLKHMIIKKLQNVWWINFLFVPLQPKFVYKTKIYIIN